MNSLTRHAATRLQQRAIPPIIVDWLLSYGKHVPAHKHCHAIFFDKFGRQRLKHDIGSWMYRIVESKLNAYVVLSEEGEVITAGYRNKRFKN